LVRQVHGRRYYLPSRHDWSERQEWEPSYQMFNQIISKELVLLSQLNLEEADLLPTEFIKNRLREKKPPFKPSIKYAVKNTIKRLFRILLPVKILLWIKISIVVFPEFDKRHPAQFFRYTTNFLGELYKLIALIESRSLIRVDNGESARGE